MFLANAGASLASGMLLILLIVAGGLYLLPAVIAVTRSHPSALAIAALNLFLGWSFIGWIVSLVWALSSTGRSSGNQTVGVNFYGGAPGPMPDPPYHQPDVVGGPQKPCTHCHSLIPIGASVCRFCQRAVTSGSTYPPAPLS